MNWGRLTNYDPPLITSATQTLAKDAQINFTAAYARQLGTVMVQVVPENASWICLYGEDQSTSRTGHATLTNIPAGSITVRYLPLAGYDPPLPADETRTLEKNGIVNFWGIYLSPTEPLLRANASILRILLGLDPETEGLDANGDGRIDAADLIYNANRIKPEP
jgi:hypothetical protein